MKAAYLVCMFLIGFVTYSWLKRDTKEEVSIKEDNVSLFAKQLVRENLKSPSTAQFVNTEVIYHKEDQNFEYYIVKVQVDAQNSFGAMIRDQYCTAFSHNKNKEETQFTYTPNSSMQNCNDQNGRVPSSLVIDIMKSENNYP